ncbi:unnamed protein product (macronuclear) [Paramecium tetraurelia]|uniref:N-acetyltransferase domain-containing protein n=1 Tax=Paramecium tetraurelia TaxID=5888 RepID=A0D2M8_PARTE|nr:uncharacterized protein GSPATT00012803001 [Paramecium tetraurelia]CAK77295.1 unnamed protein product [Paramecium tetraurelia]|eukprot:XP_001444692.1 hypothetical protein (macronuclear) [Paramecium tetraurelia strain d4-2]
MSTIKPFQIFDILDYNNINLDILTETFNVGFYGKYIAKWPEFCISIKNHFGNFQGYLLGKIEGEKANNNKQNWHGHISAITVAPEYRRQGVARFLMNYIEDVTNSQNGWYVDLFVRPSNKIAVLMYQNFGYEIYQTVYQYYSGQNGKCEDAYDMRKSMLRDKQKLKQKPTGKVIKPEDLEFN